MRIGSTSLDFGDDHAWAMYRAAQDLRGVVCEAKKREARVWSYAPAPLPRKMTQIEESKFLRKIKTTASRRNSAFLAVVQERLVAALFRGTDVDLVEAMLGYSMGDLRSHLERQFMRGMSWKNHASAFGWNRSKKVNDRSWHIDHIVPKSSFCIDDVRHAFALTNLRPLWANSNFAKSAKKTHLL